VAALDAEFKAMSSSLANEISEFKEMKTREIRQHLRELVRVNMEHQRKVVDLWKELLGQLEELQ